MTPDIELIDKFLAGDRGAFDELVVRHRKQVYSAAYRMMGNAETAEEIAQETFIRAFKGLGSFRREADVRTWLYRITMNLCYTELKRMSREKEIELEAATDATGSPHEKMEQEERMLWLEKQMNLLPFKQKSVLTLRIFHGLSFKEIGRVVGCSAGAARVNFGHAMLKIKDALAEFGAEL